jgi:glycerol-3-phosphate dehydrogenase
VANYGKQSDQIILLMNDFKEAQAEEALIRAELKFCVENEMVCSSTDFFDRRTGRLSFDFDRVIQYKNTITDDLALYLNWTDQRKIADEKLLDQRMNEVVAFRKSSLV